MVIFTCFDFLFNFRDNLMIQTVLEPNQIG